MAIHIFTFRPAIDFNTSLQRGDIVYYCPTTTLGGFDTADELTGGGGSQIIRVGVLETIHERTLSGNNPNRISRLFVNDEGTAPGVVLEGVEGFLMFSKDNKVNLNSIAGYYARVTLINNTSEDTQPELFAVSTEVAQSSK